MIFIEFFNFFFSFFLLFFFNNSGPAYAAALQRSRIDRKARETETYARKTACLFLIFLVSSPYRDATFVQSRIRNPRRVFIFSSQVYVRITKKNSIVLPKSLSILLLYCSGPSFRLLFVLDAKPTQFPKKENMKTYENIWKLTRNTYESLMKIEWKPSEIY